MFQSRRVRPSLTLVPALMTAIAYVDPGNFGSNLSAGATKGYALLWVVVLASIAAAMIQFQSAKLGLVTGRSLAEIGADRFSRPARLAAWAQAEIVVIMTDLAEIVGGAMGLYLLFGTPLPLGAVLIGVFSMAVLSLDDRRRGVLQPAVLGMLACVGVCVLATAWMSGPQPIEVLTGLRPGGLDSSGILIATAVIGATVMPHALYFHSGVSARPRARAAVLHPAGVAAGGGRSSAARSGPGPIPRGATASLLRSRLSRSVIVAMTLAGIVNVSILVIGASLPRAAADSLEAAFSSLSVSAGGVASTLLGVALLASGLASTVVGAFTGQLVMDGYLQRRLPAWQRRGISVLPPVVVLALGVDPMVALVASQAILCLALPTILVQLVWFTGSRAVMGRDVTRPATLAITGLITAVISGLNVWLLLDLAHGLLG